MLRKYTHLYTPQTLCSEKVLQFFPKPEAKTSAASNGSGGLNACQKNVFFSCFFYCRGSLFL